MKEQKKPKYKLRLALLYVGSFAASIAPVLSYFLSKWDNYIETPDDALKLSFGGIIAVAFVALKVIGKLHMPRRIILFSVIFIMAYLLKPLLSDLVMLSGMALLGEFIDLVCFQRAIRITKENMLVGKTADATASQVEEVIKKYVGNGRV